MEDKQPYTGRHTGKYGANTKFDSRKKYEYPEE